LLCAQAPPELAVSTLQEQILHEHQRTLQLRNEVKETHDQAVKDELQVSE
jgi:hypothetical protein